MSELIERRKLFEQVASHLEAWILSGELKPGDRLPTERELQTQFGVGRPAVREALITLQRSGLIEIANGAPARVAMPTASIILGNALPAVLQMLSTPSGQRHFQQVRKLFEMGLARQATQIGSDAQIASLEVALKANRAALGDRERFIATDIEFHLGIARMLHNPIVIALHDALSAWLKQQRTVSLASGGQEQTAYQAHVRIYQAIAARDAEAAEAAMRDHLEQLESAYWSMTNQPAE
jgi:GntR family transcriptional regulator, sialic acid-inducible nan operon repressor